MEREGTAPPPEMPAGEEVSSLRLILTLAVAGILAGLLIVVVNELTEPKITAYKAMKLKEAVSEVLQGPARYDTLFLVDGALAMELPAGAKPGDFKQLFVGYDGGGALKGVAMARGEAGFQDVVKIILGYDPKMNQLIGMKVLESKETPGLGDKIYKDEAFVQQFFAGPTVPLQGVKPGAGSGATDEIDMITGATISSRAVIRIINNAIEEWEPHLQAAAHFEVTAHPDAAAHSEAAADSDAAAPGGATP